MSFSTQGKFCDEYIDKGGTTGDPNDKGDNRFQAEITGVLEEEKTAKASPAD